MTMQKFLAPNLSLSLIRIKSILIFAMKLNVLTNTMLGTI